MAAAVVVGVLMLGGAALMVGGAFSGASLTTVRWPAGDPAPGAVASVRASSPRTHAPSHLSPRRTPLPLRHRKSPATNQPARRTSPPTASPRSTPAPARTRSPGPIHTTGDSPGHTTGPTTGHSPGGSPAPAATHVTAVPPAVTPAPTPARDVHTPPAKTRHPGARRARG